MPSLRNSRGRRSRLENHCPSTMSMLSKMEGENIPMAFFSLKCRRKQPEGEKKKSNGIRRRNTLLSRSYLWVCGGNFRSVFVQVSIGSLSLFFSKLSQRASGIFVV